MPCRREKNRIAARESRARKLQCLTNLQTDVAALHNANEVLRQRIDEVTEQAAMAQQLFAQLKVLYSYLASPNRPVNLPANTTILTSWVDEFIAKTLLAIHQHQVCRGSLSE